VHDPHPDVQVIRAVEIHVAQAHRHRPALHSVQLLVHYALVPQVGHKHLHRPLADERVPVRDQRDLEQRPTRTLFAQGLDVVIHVRRQLILYLSMKRG
jgi:hypothetical protein